MVTSGGLPNKRLRPTASQRTFHRELGAGVVCARRVKRSVRRLNALQYSSREVWNGYQVEAHGLRVIGHNSCPINSSGFDVDGGCVMAVQSERCPECHTSNNNPAKGDGNCIRCSGTGVDTGVAVLAGSEVDCEGCGGTGVCPACNGEGEVEGRAE